MHYFKKSYKVLNGFTLIELIIVIVILGILATVAAPRFIDMKSDATIAVLNSVEADLKQVSQMVYAKALIDGLNKGEQSLSVDAGININIVNGYPKAHWDETLRHIIDRGVYNSWGVSDNCDKPLCGAGNTSSITIDGGIVLTGLAAVIWPEGYAIDDLCSVHYVNLNDSDTPLIGKSTSGC
uniref:prepilin-type N-terminal cleavage/methylation domain-containing protein n=1 Tax=Ningiella ruwaisensis TaxID=2364274 RepID=UPI0010A03468|nr:prepilin-type N-terminal cleavage/methylation domain-containing protein [Ningiella ruwaisensis]